MKIIALLILNACLISVLPSSIGVMSFNAEQQAAWNEFHEDTKDLNRQFWRQK